MSFPKVWVAQPPPGWGFLASILIVEDEDQVRVLAEGILQDLGAYYATARRSTKHSPCLKALNGRVIFTDIGLQWISKLGHVRPRSNQTKTRCPRPVHDGQGLTDGMQAMFVERYGFLAKPYTHDQLVVAVENLLPKT